MANPNLVPVDYDPFGGSQGVDVGPRVKLVPVEHDPFKGQKPLAWSDVPGQALSNAPASAGHLVSNLANMVAHPIDTVTGLADLGAGAIREGAKRVLPAGVVSAIDSFDAPETTKRIETAATSAGQFLKDRYGGEEKIKRTLATDPVGVAADAAAVLGGGGGLAARAPGVVGRVGEAAQAAVTAIDPLANAARAGYAVAHRPINVVRSTLANQGRAGAYGKAAEAIGDVDTFANNVATGSGNNVAAIQRETLDVLGEAMTQTGGNVQAANQIAQQILVQRNGLSPAAAADRLTRLRAIHRGNAMTMADYTAVADANAATRGRAGAPPQHPANNAQFPEYVEQRLNPLLDDVNRTTDTQAQSLVDVLANNGNLRSAATARTNVGRSAEGVPNDMRDALLDLSPQMGNRPMRITDTAAQSDTLRQLGSADYQAAHGAGIVGMTPQQANASMTQFLAAQLDRASRRSGVEGRIIRSAINEFYVPGPNGQRVMINAGMPDYLQLLQDARSAVGATIRQAVRDGNDNVVNALQPLYNSHGRGPDITSIMTQMSPQWARANQRWGRMNFEEMAQELGDAFSNRAGPRFREQLEEFRGLDPQAQNLVRTHWIQKQLDNLVNARDTNNVTKYFTSEQFRHSVAALFSPQEAVDLTRAIRDMAVREKGRGMIGGTRTHTRKQAQEQLDQGTDIAAAVQMTSVKGIWDGIANALKHMLKERINRPLADIMTTPMGDTARVAENIARMRAQQQRLHQLRNPAPWRPSSNAGLAFAAGGGAGVTEGDQRRRGLAYPPPQ